jgi:NADH-quinone oxidoreductase subunit E
MSTKVPPGRLPETKMMDAKLQDLGRDTFAALQPAFVGDAEAVKRNIATSAAMAALGAGMAGHAFGVWLSAVSSSLEAAQRFSDLALGKAAPARSPSTPEAAAQKAEASVAAAKVVAREPVEVPAKRVAKATIVAAPKATERPDTPDDLKAIGGIGPKLEVVLNGLGVWTYAQIAGLTEGEVQWLDEHLGFRGRIARDDWLKQAAALAGANG